MLVRLLLGAWLGLCLTLAAGQQQTTFGQTPAATQSLNQAGMVVAYGDGHLTYVYAAFTESSISAFELLERSGLPYVSVEFGGLGQGICSIGDRGCGPDTCRQNLCQSRGANAPFWHLFRQNERGEWDFLALGASGTRVEDGDILGWSWTSDEPGLGAFTLEEPRSRLDVVNGEAGVTIREVYLDAEPLEENSRQPWSAYAVGAGLLFGMSMVAIGLVAHGRRTGPVD
ncbi:MAG: hypothetical protein M3R06_11515 [Chloroflexota bacterium]|nr:hypothetical protein [Chloroflexota bacterium]